MDIFVLMLICITVMFITFRAFVDFSNNPDLTVNDWLEIYIYKFKEFCYNLKNKCLGIFKKK